MKTPFLPIITLLICAFSSCSIENRGNRDEKDIQEVADSFSVNYYRWRFKDAARHSTEDYQRYLKYLSSNVSKSDIETLKSSTETMEVTRENISITDDEAKVVLELKNIYLMDTLGASIHMQEQASHTLFMKKVNGKWKVDKVIY